MEEVVGEAIVRPALMLVLSCAASASVGRSFRARSTSRRALRSHRDANSATARL